MNILLILFIIFFILPIFILLIVFWKEIMMFFFPENFVKVVFLEKTGNIKVLTLNIKNKSSYEYKNGIYNLFTGDEN